MGDEYNTAICFSSLLAYLFFFLSPPQHYLEEAIRSEHLQVCKFQLEKCLQLYSTTLVRHGVMALGPTGGGKSTAFYLLAKALNAAYEQYYNKLSGDNTLKQTTEQGTATANVLKVQACSPSCACCVCIYTLFFMHYGLLQVSAPKTLLHCQVKKINPKCLTIGELYGFQDARTLEWVEGVLSKTIRNFFLQNHTGKSHSQSCPIVEDVPKTSISDCTAADTGLPYPPCASFGWRWAILDGPIDPEWVENLNSTLDDSKLLCLSNGERIELGIGTRILFETDDLSQASPATISRCGIVFMVCSNPLLHSRFHTLFFLFFPGIEHR